MSELSPLLFDHYGYFLASGPMGIVKFKITSEIVNYINKAIEEEILGNESTSFVYPLKHAQEMFILDESKMTDKERDVVFDKMYCEETDSFLSVVDFESFPFPSFSVSSDDDLDNQFLGINFEIYDGQITIFALLNFHKDSEDEYVYFTITCKHLKGVVGLADLLNEKAHVIKSF